MRKFLPLFVLGVILCLTQGQAAETSAPPETNPATVTAHYRVLLQRSEFRQVSRPDFLTQLGHWIVTTLESLQDSFKKYEYSSQLIRLSYALMWSILVLSIGALFYWGVKLFLWRHSFEETELEKAAGQPYFAPPESFEPEIRQAVGSQQWPAALSLSWRRFLSLLERRELVAADRTRTNWEYIAQLQSRPMPAATSDLCRQLATAYDRHIYGARPLTPEDWARWQTSLETVSRTLKLEQPPTSAR